MQSNNDNLHNFVLFCLWRNYLNSLFFRKKSEEICPKNCIFKNQNYADVKDKYDLVIFIESLLYSKEPEKIIQNLLKENGIAIVVDDFVIDKNAHACNSEVINF